MPGSHCDRIERYRIVAEPYRVRFFRSVVLVMDSSAAAIAALEQAVPLLEGQSGVDVTVLFVACGRCQASRKFTFSGAVLEQAASDNYCPGTQTALRKTSDLLTSRSIAYRTHVVSGVSIAEAIVQRANQGSADIMIVAATLVEDILPTLSVPILVLSAGEQKPAG